MKQHLQAMAFLFILCAVIFTSLWITESQPAPPQEPTLPVQTQGPATGWVELPEGRCYLLEDGTRATGWLELEGRRYYLMPDGTAATGPVTVEGRRYIFDESGALADGEVCVGGTYYLAQEGLPQKGWHTANGQRRYFDRTGTAVTGWLELEDGLYCFKKDGTPQQGKVVLAGRTHYFTSQGREVILVNPWNQIPEDYTVELADIGRGHQIAAGAVADFEQMMADCRADGLNPVVCSSYRTQEYQEHLYQNRIDRYVWSGCSLEEATTLAGQSVAVPGTSEHQLGLALDIIDNSNWNLDESQADTPAQQWLMENSWRYGWILRYPEGTSDLTGITYEPWHYRYVGRELAQELHSLDLCLEAYLDALTPSVG